MTAGGNAPARAMQPVWSAGLRLLHWLLAISMIASFGAVGIYILPLRVHPEGDSIDLIGRLFHLDLLDHTILQVSEEISLLEFRAIGQLERRIEIWDPLICSIFI